MKDLKKDPDIFMVTADKRRAMVILDKSEFHSLVNKMLTDPTTYRKLKKDPTSTLQRRDEKHKVERTLRRSSIVYAKKSPRRPKVYEHAKRVHYLASAEYRFTSPRVPELFPTLTTKLESHTSTFTPDRKSPSTRETTTTVGLPPIPDPSLKASLLRRPTTIGTRPLEEKDEGFQAFANRLDLKPITIDDSPSKTLKFYTHKYLLLLQKLLKEDRDKYADRRSVNPNLGPDPLKRGSDVGKRLVVLNMALEELDKETIDCRFITELREDTFDPRRWPWNRNRYQK
ncbi:uncharacterized protein LOC124266165 [Haliotis rubra]|uniref:uncharacterized protein LOC124266165 n=1 Tax=Haliotis rubra TaxID=36100 RepID=UPI001EE63410|nr:uncharacterized protein LOC124266165 [Haliotis rubra]